MNDDIQFVNYAWGPLLLHFKYPKEDITKLKRICKKAKGHKDWSGELAGVFPKTIEVELPVGTYPRPLK